MRCETTADPAAFWELAAGFLLGDPVVNSVLLTNVAARRAGTTTDPAPATYAAVLDGAKTVVGAAMRTPPFGIVLSSMPDAAVAPLAGAMEASCPDAVGVSGPGALAEAFSVAWAARTGAGVALEHRTRLHRLDAVTPPPALPGLWRLAGPADRDLLVDWTGAFELETGLGVSGTAAMDVESRLAGDRAFLWIDGGPVSYVATSGPSGGVVRVGPVYTPPERRARGYATALVAAVSQRALDGGAATCSLFTDAANPTANRIYATVGYRWIGDFAVFGFGAPAVREGGGTRPG